MSQEEVRSIVQMYYSEKIELSTLNDYNLNFILCKPSDDGLKEFRSHSVNIENVPFDTEQDIRNIIDDIISSNLDWYNG